MKEKFINKNFSRKTLDTIDFANDIIEDYSQMGLRLTLRQLYYQFVSRDLIPNEQKQYDRLGSIISDARLAGLIDWSAIEDRTRSSLNHDGVWNSPEEIITSCYSGYNIPFWEKQPEYIEVWVEKEALAGVVSDACRNLKVRSFACKGYTSQSEMYNAGLRIRDAIMEEKKVVIIHLGDHDPSGIDMTRDIDDRLTMFGYPNSCGCGNEYCDLCRYHELDVELGNVPIEVNRIALNMEQINQYNPPPNPAKMTDSRFKSYLKRFGNKSWELDALDPKILQHLIKEEIKKHIDWSIWDECKKREEQEKTSLKQIASNYDEIIDYLN